MAVRFLPPPGEPEPGGGPDRADLAEVIELRGMLRQRAWGDQAGAGAPEEGAFQSGESPAPEPALTDADADGSSADSGAWGSASFGVGSTRASAPAAPVSEAEQDAADASGERAPAAPARGAVVSSLTDRLRPASALLAGPSGQGETERPTSARRAAAASETRGEAAAEQQFEDPTRTVTEDGVRLLARRARSSGELREELLRLDHAAGDVDILIDEFISSHYLDDLGLARTVTEKFRTTKRASRSQIRIKLRERRLPDEVIDEALGELDADEEFSLLREAAVSRAAKLGGLDRQVAERRLLGFLARRGWSGQAATQAAKDALDGASRGSGGSGVRFR